MEKYRSKIKYHNQVVREKDRNWFKEMSLVLMLTLMIAGAVMFYVWQQVEITKYGYKIEQMKGEKEILEKLNRELKLECSYLGRLDRIERIAKEELNMIEPEEEQVIIVRKEDLENAYLQNAKKDFKENKVKVKKDDR